MLAFLYDLSVYFLNFLIMLFVIFSYQRLSGYKISFSKSILATILSAILYSLVFEMSSDWLYQYLTATLNNEIIIMTIYLTFLNLSNYIVLVLSIYFLLDKNMKRVFLYSALSWSLFQFIYYILNNFCYAISSTDKFAYLFVSFFAICISDVLLSYFIKKTDFSYLQHFIDKKETSLTKLVFISIGIDLAYVIVRIIIDRKTFNFNLSEFVLLIILLIMIYYFSKNYTALIKTQEEKKYSQAMLHQQELYVKDLEDIHQNMRSFKHDFKNMMASLYLKSTQGDVKAVEQDLHQLISEFDENIDKKMNLTNQIANIHCTELKSLLFQKMTEIEKYKISFDLEVMYPIEKVSIKSLDLCRILGILLDNAIEEVKDHKGKITLILSNQKDGLHMIVENTIHSDIDMMKIYQKGYSTKENHSGLGLSSLKSIIEIQAGIAHMSEIKNGLFIQDIFISEVR